MTPDARAQITSLLARLADGDRSAVDAAFDALWPLVRDFCARALGNAADAEDAAQQALVRVFEQVADYDRERDALAWVLTIAGYEVRTIRRRATRRREDAHDAESYERSSSRESPEDLLIDRDLCAAVRDVLASLRPEDAATIAASFGLSNANAPTDAPSPATFRKRLQRALERLRGAWRTKHGTP